MHKKPQQKPLREDLFMLFQSILALSYQTRFHVHGSMSMHFLYQSSGMGTHFYLL